MDMFEAIATSPTPEYRRVNKLPPDTLAQIHTHCPEASAEIEYLRTWLPDTCEEVFQANLIVRYPGYSACFITTANELQNFLRDAT